MVTRHLPHPQPQSETPKHCSHPSCDENREWQKIVTKHDKQKHNNISKEAVTSSLTTTQPSDVDKEEIQAQAKRPKTNIDEKHRLTGRKVQRWCGLPSSSHHQPWRLHCNNGDLDFRVKKGRWLERLREKGEKIETKKEYNVLICY
ncbi:hypothetical protein QL285_006312 [Trifolium repens]|nr:hypothetical protein QL285_006312 [Trifolium repens]